MSQILDDWSMVMLNPARRDLLQVVEDKLRLYVAGFSIDFPVKI